MRKLLMAQIGAATFLTSALPLLGSGAALAEAAAPYVTLHEQNFRTRIDGKQVDLYTIRNRAGMEARITNYGARIEQLLVPDRDGRPGDVVQGYETIDQVRNGQGSMGAFIGRYANRIANGRFTLEGKEYQLSLNSGPHSSHGGAKGSRFRVFDAKRLSDSSVEMTYVFADGEEGYPGTLPLRVVYTITDNDELAIDYAAVAVDKPTVVNLTSHAFFNLSGNLGQPVLDHVVTIDADKVLEVDDSLIPTGALRDVAGTPMDFRAPATIGSRIDEDYDLLRRGRGYDHAYVINRGPGGGLRLAATVHEPGSGRVMEVWSTEPSVQFFTANSLTGEGPRDVGKGDTPYVSRSAFCVEPQHYPDSPNHPEFPSTVLRPGQWYAGQIVYRFSVQR
jgi:aldose 1-epimerase